MEKWVDLLRYPCHGCGLWFRLNRRRADIHLALKRKHLWHLLPVVCVWQSRNSAAIPSIAILAHEQNLLIAVLHFRLRFVLMENKTCAKFSRARDIVCIMAHPMVVS
ncbi:MAG: hypothetical protein RSI33_13780 [Clostridia bacterium]